MVERERRGRPDRTGVAANHSVPLQLLQGFRFNTDDLDATLETYNPNMLSGFNWFIGGNG